MYHYIQKILCIQFYFFFLSVALDFLLDEAFALGLESFDFVVDLSDFYNVHHAITGLLGELSVKARNTLGLY